DSRIDAFALAASAAVSGSTSSTSVALSLGLALAHNRIDGDVSAGISGSGVLTGGGDVTVRADDAAAVEVTSVAAAVSVALGAGTSVGVAGGASESTNVILSRTNASIESSTIGSDDDKVGKVVVGATSTSQIDATVGAVAAAVALGDTGVGVAVGVAVARNFVGWDPNASSPTSDYLSTDLLTAGLATG